MIQTIRKVRSYQVNTLKVFWSDSNVIEGVMPELTDISKRIAGALLLRNREISVRDIRAVPFVESDDDVDAIVSALVRSFTVEMVQRRSGSGSGISAWEDVIQLASGSNLGTLSKNHPR
jgi:hypothetical protein